MLVAQALVGGLAIFCRHPRASVSAVRDGPFLRAVKRVALWNFRVNLAAARALRRLRGERPWTLGGSCRRSGACCEAPAIAVGWLVWSLPSVRRLVLAWHRRVNGFEPVSADTGARALVFRCTHYDAATRSCDSYDSRPGMCRDYPRLLLWQASPELFAPCGYRVTPPNAGRLRAEIERRGLPAEQREKLRRGLRLDD